MKFSFFKAAWLFLIETHLSKKTVKIELELTINETVAIYQYCKWYKNFNHNKDITAVCNKYLKELERQNITVKSENIEGV